MKHLIKKKDPSITMGGYLALLFFVVVAFPAMHPALLA